MEQKRYSVMLVDDNMANLAMGKHMLRDIYKVYAVPSVAKLFEILKVVASDLILLDIEMPEMNGYEAIKKLKADERFADIPVIFLTSKHDEESELMGLSLGAIDYVHKPFSGPLLLKRIENHILIGEQKRTLQTQALALESYADHLQDMVAAKSAEIAALKNATIDTMADMVEFRDSTTGGHVMRTGKYMKALADQLVKDNIYPDEVSQWDLEFLASSAQLHDIGKIAISDTILNKPGKLTPEEFEIMKRHVPIGIQVIRRIKRNTAEHSFLRHAEAIAGAHHEKWDGSGYPAGLKGSDIPLEGRMMAIADVYDALISARPYKKAFGTKEAERIIREGSGTHFDPVLVQTFLAVADRFAKIADLHTPRQTAGA